MPSNPTEWLPALASLRSDFGRNDARCGNLLLLDDHPRHHIDLIVERVEKIADPFGVFTLVVAAETRGGAHVHAGGRALGTQTDRNI